VGPKPQKSPPTERGTPRSMSATKNAMPSPSDGREIREPAGACRARSPGPRSPDRAEEQGANRQNSLGGRPLCGRKNFEREAVSGERDLMRDALKRAMGEAPLSRIQQQFNQEVERVANSAGVSCCMGRSFTTDEMIAWSATTSA